MTHTHNGKPCNYSVNEDGWCAVEGWVDGRDEPPAEVERAADPVLAWLKTLGRGPWSKRVLISMCREDIARRRAELEGRHDAR